MAIPQIPEFERFLSSISMDAHAEKEGRQFFDAVRAHTHFDGREFFHIPAISASYLPGTMTFEAALKRLGEEVQKSKHLANDSMLRLLLGLSAITRPLEISAVAHFNDITDKICEGDCSNFLIGDIEDKRATRTKIGNFRVGEIDVEKIRYRCKKAGCDYFDRYPTAFQDRYGIEKEPYKVRVVDLGALPSPRVARRTMLAMQDEYFRLLSLNLLTEFIQEFEQDTLLAAALGAPILDSRTLFSLNGYFVSIFEKCGKWRSGHFRPIGADSSIVFCQSEDEIASVQTELREQFSFSKFDHSGIHQSLKTFSKLVVRARQLQKDGAAQEAFLACVIALESLFVDGRDTIGRSLSTRLAVVAAGPLKQKVAEVEKLITKLYDSRSNYVHNGIEVSADHLEKVWPIVEAAIKALLRLHANSPDRDNVSIENWLGKLDYLYKSLTADEIPPASKFVEYGLIPPPKN